MTHNYASTANRAIVADPAEPGVLGIRDVAPPRPTATDAVVAVRAFSLNAGEVREALHPDREWRPGWDLAGTVVAAASDGTGPAVGAPVVGFAGIGGGGWARHVAVPAGDLAVIPDSMSIAEAACLPVAGLTALYCLARGGQLLGRSVLITGASGGVGQFACQLAAAAGAAVSAAVRTERSTVDLQKLGVQHIIVGDGPLPDPFDLILESVGGPSLARSLASLRAGGTCVLYGNASQSETTFRARDFYGSGNVTLEGFFLGTELAHRPAGPGLAQLLTLVERGMLSVPLSLESSWTDLSSVARRFHEREITGKVVLHLGA